MNLSSEDNSRNVELYTQIKNSFGSGLVSALSVVQGVALAELGAVLTIDFPHLSVLRWLQATTTFFLLIAVWDTITKDALIWRWIPGFQESLIPFVLGGVELYLTYSVTLDISYWLFGMAGAAWLRGIGYWHVMQRGREEDESRRLLDHVKGHFRVQQLYSVLGALLFAGLAVGNLTGTFAGADKAVNGTITWSEPVVGFVWVAGSLLGVALYWQKLITRIRPTKTQYRQSL